MILQFCVENFRSFRTQQKLSLVSASSRKGDGSVFKAEGVDVGVLPVAVIYGANASGKTNVLRALHFFRSAIADSQNSWKPNSKISHQPFRPLGDSSQSRFELDFLLEKDRYTYGFSVASSHVTGEWLYAYPNRKKQTLFSRKDQTFAFGKAFTGNKKLIEGIVRSNSLFLSAAAQNNHELLTRIHSLISDWIIITDERKSVVDTTSKICQDDESRKLLSELVRSADLGIVGLRTRKRSVTPKTLEIIGNFTSNMPEEMAEDFRRRVMEKPQIEFLHAGPNGKEFVIQSSQESRGTLNYFGLIAPIISILEAGGVLIIDELDESLHPSLIRGIIKLFVTRSSNPRGAQLIFNTHDTNLLDLELIRRDEIWFTEKDSEGATHLYPLTDFHPRNSENIQKGYIEGRYGAIPFIGDFSLLLGDQN